MNTTILKKLLELLRFFYGYKIISLRIYIKISLKFIF